MAQRRMFSNAVIDNDRFLDMPLSTQALYFHLGLKADDDGFVGSPKKIARSVTCTEKDLKNLIDSGFVIAFNSGVIVITHWHEHNTIRKERKKDTLFQAEKLLLSLDESNIYSIGSESDTQLTPTCRPTGTQMSAQYNIVKCSVVEEKEILSAPADAQPRFDFQSVISCFNSVCISLPKAQKLTDKRRKAIKNAHKLLGEMTFQEFFELVERSDFLTGRTGKWNGCCFDWVLCPSNLTKIVEGNYSNTAEKAIPAPRNYDEVF